MKSMMPYPSAPLTMRGVRNGFDAFLHCIPSICELCGAWPTQRICKSCWLQHAPVQHRCHRCAIVVPDGVTHCGQCIKHPPAFDACFAATDYQPPWISVLHQFKFGDEPAWSRHLAAGMLAIPAITDAIAAADWVIPVAMTDTRLCERGYNQSHLLAKQLSLTKTAARALHKLNSAAPQRGLDRSARLKNLHRAFAVDPTWQHQIQGQRCVLVDDVMTTGATLEAASQALKAAGASHITAAIFARTPKN